jgi:protein tyrosine/serine phosphatase
MDYITAGFKVIYDRVVNYFYNDGEEENNQNVENINIITKQPTKNTEIDLITPSNERIFNPLSTFEQLSWFFSNPTHVIDNIYIGSAHNAANKKLLKSLSIKYIINVTVEIKNYYPDTLIYANYSLYDDNKQSIDKYLENSYKKIKEFQKNNDGNILIHCFMGASRSATILAYYLIREKGYTPMDSYNYIKSKRNLVNPTQKLFRDLSKSSLD